MNRKKEKPIYGNSQGAKSGGLNSNPQRKPPPEKQYAKSGELFDDRSSQLSGNNYRSTQLKPAKIKSFPRTIFKLSIVGIIVYQLLANTQIGRGLTARASQQVADLQRNMDTTRSKLDPKTRGEKRQKVVEDRFEDAWQRAGGESEKKE
jgi:hypothetical protein